MNTSVKKILEDLEEADLKTTVKIKIQNRATKMDLYMKMVEYAGAAVLVYLILEFMKWWLSQPAGVIHPLGF